MRDNTGGAAKSKVAANFCLPFTEHKAGTVERTVTRYTERKRGPFSCLLWAVCLSGSLLQLSWLVRNIGESE